MSGQALPWLVLAGLGALHGINPGMGWLFAVGLGLQEQSGRAVWRALLPLACGHALAIAAALLLASVVGLVLPPVLLKVAVVAALGSLGIFRLFRHSHARGFGMRASTRDLVAWSFLMASAHGAGFMLLPVLLDVLAGTEAPCCAQHHVHAEALAAGISHAQSLQIFAALVHTSAYLLVSGVIAALVYHKIGLRVLRTWWFNFDALWAGALILTALLTALL